MTLQLLGMELKTAENLLAALNMRFSVEYVYAKKPLPYTDSVRVMRQTEDSGGWKLTVGEFKTAAD